MTHREIGSMITKHVRELGIMIQLLGLLGIEKDERLLCLIIDIARLLVDGTGNLEQKVSFLNFFYANKILYSQARNVTRKTAREGGGTHVENFYFGEGTYAKKFWWQKVCAAGAKNYKLCVNLLKN